MKNLSEMDLYEKTSWACGTILIGIGDGKFRSAMSGVIIGITADAYDRGKKAGIEIELGRQKEKQKRKRSKLNR